jgi:uroporphyrin-III C-methyltransferase
MRESADQSGKVFIVGAGPGAEDLITLRGLRALQQADVVLYDALVSSRFMDQFPPCAERIYVGKRCGKHSLKQEEINRLIISKSREGKIVVRLKGGDPLIFGRGGEEALACFQAGVDFEIVPGVSAALGAASYAGIPLTHRGVSSSVAFVTAHGAQRGESPDLTWIGLAGSVDTLVIFMGAAWLGKIVAALLKFGLPKTKPVAAVSNATCRTQATVLATLETIEAEVTKAGLQAPILIIVGEVARLNEKLNWFERQIEAVSVGAASS